jgi:hypothetical protein
LIGRNEAWHRHHDEILRICSSFIGIWVREDYVGNAIVKHCSTAPPTGVKPDEVPDLIPPFFFLKHDPILCGLMQCYLLESWRHFGVAFSNCYNDILASAHLYNAAKQSKIA